ncbi:MAG TPA: hypothetical protein P5089_02425 [Candidatus Portnoybacteria bacterium]|nr:hypothetical protein [Candidatus Portnoybacteria bacterium]
MKTRCFIIIAIIIAVVAIALYFILKQPAMAPEGPEEGIAATESSQPGMMTVNEALAVAQASDCLKEGRTINETGEIFYNDNSKTWWFDLKADKAGCSPACVVSENKTAEINWRCTGAIIPDESNENAIKQILAAKYPKYAQTLSVKISQEAEDFARGSVSFAPGAPGGLFLAAKVNGQWQVVHDGNGQIPCTLSSYGFPANMLADCAK